jgi:hypothetical protein
MAGFVDTVERLMLDHFTGKTAYTVPTWYVGLSTTQPTDAGGNFTEPSAGAYARVTLTAATWTAANDTTPASTSYGGTITFPAATGGWGTVGWWGVFSVATPSTGIVQAWATLNAQKAIQTSDTGSFAANTFLIKMGDPVDTY